MFENNFFLFEKFKVKKEKTNPCFVSRKEFLDEKNFYTNNKKKTYFLNNNFTQKKKSSWNKERKLFDNLFFSKKNLIRGLVFRTRPFFYVEEFMLENFPTIDFLFMKSPFFFDILFLGKFSKIIWNNFLLIFQLKKHGFYAQRFRLFEKIPLKPQFLCWGSEKNFNNIFGLISFGKTFYLRSFHLISVMLMKLRPLSLKIAIFTKESILFFSIDNGFSSNCPLFSYKYLKKKKKYFKGI